MTALETLMREWLANGTEREKRHAAFRLRLPFDADPAASPLAPPAAPAARATLAGIRAVNACPHRGCRTGCQAALCAAGRGDFAGGREASIGHCLACVAGDPSTPVE